MSINMIKGKKVAAVITDGFHNTELYDPMNALLDEGAEVTVFGVNPEHVTKGVLDHIQRGWPDEMKPKELFKAHKLIDEARSEDFDALLIPGGFSPEKLRTIPKVIEFVRDIYAEGKLIAAICHGPLVLISAKIVNGKNMTCVSSIADDLQNAGAIYLDKPLVICDNIVTSRTPADMEHFIRAIKDMLQA